MSNSMTTLPDRPDSPPYLIETMQGNAQQGVPLLAQHLTRLQHSAEALHYPCPLEAIRTAIEKQCQKLNSHAHRLRLCLHANGEFSLTADPLAPTPQPVQLSLSRTALPNSSWLQHKSNHRPWYDAAQIWLSQHPAYFDVLFLNEHDQLCEGSRSNVYLFVEGQWLTPLLGAGLLPGVMRAQLLEQGLVREAALTKQDLLNASAWRVSNALRGWLDATLDATEINL